MSEEPSHPLPPLVDTLTELEHIHTLEAEVLRAPDPEKLDAIASRKLTLCEQLKGVLGQRNLAPQEQALLRRLRKTALFNQVLLLHARETVFGILELAGAIPQSTSFSRSVPVQEGVRVNFRG